MTARLSVSVLAFAVLTGTHGLSSAGEATGADHPLMLAQTTTTTPPAATTPPATTAPAAPSTSTAPATPPATTAPSTAAPSATPSAPTPSEPTPPAAGTGGQSTPGADGTDSGATQDNGDTPDNEQLSLGEIPTIETMELTPELAKRALDSYLVAKEKYANTDLDQYENLQDFVDQTEDGKKFEADVKAAGFANVSDWNLAVTTLGLTYSSVTNDQTSDLQQQIKEVQDDTQLAQDMKDKMIKALKALIPSDNNKKVVQDLMNDPTYGPKMKQLDIEEE